MDFTINKYKEFLDGLIQSGYSFQTFYEFVTKPLDRVIILRHDVDKRPLHSLEFALIQNQLGISGSYYFRIVSGSFDEKIIRKIYSLGHEIGYHYETMDTSKGNIELAYQEFCVNLDLFRKIVPVHTVCMHGSPNSRFDNRAIWDHYSYKQWDIVAEPYLDTDFNKVFYLTDTGRRFDGAKVSIRDKPKQQIYTKWPSYHSTADIIKSLHEKSFPDVSMITIHPQRWTNNCFLWFKELCLQNIKNKVKRYLVSKKPKEVII